MSRGYHLQIKCTTPLTMPLPFFFLLQFPRLLFKSFWALTAPPATPPTILCALLTTPITASPPTFLPSFSQYDRSFSGQTCALSPMPGLFRKGGLPFDVVRTIPHTSHAQLYSTLLLTTLPTLRYSVRSLLPAKTSTTNSGTKPSLLIRLPPSPSLSSERRKLCRQSPSQQPLTQF